MKVLNITFANGLIINNISEDMSNRIGLVLFGDKNVPATTETDEPKIIHKRKRLKGYRSKKWTSKEESLVLGLYQEYKSKGFKSGLIAREIGRRINRSTASVTLKINRLKKYPVEKIEVPGPEIVREIVDTIN